MASAHATTNGSYAGQEHYNGSQYAENGNTAEKSGDQESTPEEIGWYFVMRYYETLSQGSDKLHVS